MNIKNNICNILSVVNGCYKHIIRWLFAVVFIIIFTYLGYRAYVLCSNTCISDMSSCDDYCMSQLNIKELITATIALLAFCISYFEYKIHNKKCRAETLALYNKRYYEDHSFKAIIMDLIAYEDGRIDKYNIRDKASNNISVIYEREMFMRFFEELQIQIEEGNLDKDTTRTLFLWYAKEIDKLGNYFISDYNEDCWDKFKKFIK